LTSLIWPGRLPATAPVFAPARSQYGQNEVDSKKELRFKFFDEGKS